MLTETKTETRWQRWRQILRQALNGEEQEFTTGSIDRAIVLLSIPMILEMMMESLFAIVDIYFVSKLSTEAAATVGVTESVLTLIYSIAIGLSAAATAMVARRIGEGKRKAASIAGAQIILIALCLSVVIAVIGFFFAKDILLSLQMIFRDREEYKDLKFRTAKDWQKFRQDNHQKIELLLEKFETKDLVLQELKI